VQTGHRDGRVGVLIGADVMVERDLRHRFGHLELPELAVVLEGVVFGLQLLDGPDRFAHTFAMFAFLIIDIEEV